VCTSALKEQPGRDIGVGGAGLARACMELGLIDEWRLFVSPVLLGDGTPYFPPLEKQINLELVETKTFGSRVVYLRYRRCRTACRRSSHLRTLALTVK